MERECLMIDMKQTVNTIEFAMLFSVYIIFHSTLCSFVKGLIFFTQSPTKIYYY